MNTTTFAKFSLNSKMILLTLFLCIGNLSLGQNLLVPAKKDSVLKPIPMNVIIDNIVADKNGRQ